MLVNSRVQVLRQLKYYNRLAFNVEILHPGTLLSALRSLVTVVIGSEVRILSAIDVFIVAFKRIR